MPDGTRWGVYVKPQTGTNPTTNTITGSGQVTLVAPLNFDVIDFTPVSGNWANNATINGPIENPSKTYISFGLVADQPKIVYSSTAPTLLFTFKKLSSVCPDELYLIENGVDPLDQLPNSVNINPGNELTVFDSGNGFIYSYGENYAPYAWDCNDCDADGIPNAHEDTNGDGQWTPGVDVSDLCNGTGGGCIEISAAQLQCTGGGTACGNNPTGQLSLLVNITGGQAPFTVKYSDGTTVGTLQNYQSGTAFQVAAVNGAVYTLLEVKGADGCIADGTNLSGEVPVTIPGALQFATQPNNATVCSGSSAFFTTCASATNATFSFSWQYSTDGGATWQAVPMGLIFNQTNTAATSNGCDTLLVGSTIGLQGYRFRALASGNNVPTAYSQPATLSIEGLLQVSSQPQNATVCTGNSAVFTASFTNSGAGTVNYQWQTSTNGGMTWTDIAPSANFEGTTTTDLTINNAAGMNNSRFRLKAQTGNCPAAFTQASQLTVEGPVEILAVISPVTVCRGEEACFEVQANLLGAGQLRYQWQVRQNGSANWTDIQGANATILCLASTDGLNGNCYRVMVGTDACQTVTSVEACLVVEDKANFTQQPQSLTKCAGEAAELTASAAITNGYAGQLSYRWQTSTDGGQNWQDLDNDGNHEGAFDAMLIINDLSTVANRIYRLSASTGICETTYSDAAGIILDGPISISEQPQGMTICPGEQAVFTASASNQGAGALQLQWQASSNGSDWTDIAEGSNFTGTQTTTLTVLNTITARQFRLVASTANCGAIYSEAALLDVEAPIVFSEQPASTTACPDEPVSFTAIVNGAGTLQLQWQSSQDGTNWSDIAEGGIYSGTNSTTLNIAEAAGLDGMRFRLVAASQTCSNNSGVAVLTLESDDVCNPVPGDSDCVTLSVKKLDNNIGWSVWVKADSSFTETPYQLPTGGKVTLVAPLDFAFQGLTSHNGGTWKPGKVYFNPPQDPGKIYIEFNLTPNQNFLELTPGVERLLFTFAVVGGCPTSLSLMESIVPQGFFPNQFSGYGSGLTQEKIPFHFCGNYGQGEWECPPTMNLMAPTGDNTVAVGQQLALDPNAKQGGFGQKATEAAQPSSYFGVAPNPARDEMTVTLDEAIVEKPAMLRLWNLQGQLLYAERIEGTTTHRLDLGQTVPGTYFLTLEVDGKVAQREKIIVH